MRSKKPKCYQSFRYNVCLGRTTRFGVLAARCRKCRWLEREQREATT